MQAYYGPCAWGALLATDIFYLNAPRMLQPHGVVLGEGELVLRAALGAATTAFYVALS